MPDMPSAEPTEAHPAEEGLVCGICGKPVEALHTAGGVESLDVPQFLRRHGRCLAKGAVNRPTRRRR